MRLHDAFGAATLVAAAVWLLLPGTAKAGEQYQSTIVGEPSTVNTTDIHLKAGPSSNKVTVKANPAHSGTGLVVQLVVSNVDCPAEGNDKGKTGKCGVAATKSTPQAPVPAMFVLSARFGGADYPDVFGVPIQFLKGQALFVSTGKTSQDGSAFGSLIGAILGQPIGIFAKIRTQGTDVTQCPGPFLNTETLGNPPASNGCTDGTPLFFTGVTASI
jgi:hypothetical protein